MLKVTFVQLDEDIKTILQRYEGIVEEDSEQTSNEATLSYLDYLANLDSEQVREEVAKRSAATKEHTRKLLQYVEMSGPFTSKSTVIKEKSNDEIDVEGEGSKGKEVINKKENTMHAYLTWSQHEMEFGRVWQLWGAEGTDESLC